MFSAWVPVQVRDTKLMRNWWVALVLFSCTPAYLRHDLGAPMLVDGEYWLPVVEQDAAGATRVLIVQCPSDAFRSNDCRMIRVRANSEEGNAELARQRRAARADRPSSAPSTQDAGVPQ